MIRRSTPVPPTHLIEYSAPFIEDTVVPERLRKIFRTAHQVANVLSSAPTSKRPVPTVIFDESAHLSLGDTTKLLNGYPFGLHTFLGATVILASAGEEHRPTSPQKVTSIRDGFVMDIRIVDIQTFEVATSTHLRADDLNTFRRGTPSAIRNKAVRETGRLTARVIPPSWQEPGSCSALGVASPAQSETEWRQDLRMDDLTDRLDTIAPWTNELQTSLNALLTIVQK